MRFERKSALTLVWHAVWAVFFLVCGIIGVVTGHLGYRGRSFGDGSMAARAIGVATVLASLAWLRAVWLQRGGRLLDADDGLLKFLVLLTAVVGGAALPLLFFDVAT